MVLGEISLHGLWVFEINRNASYFAGAETDSFSSSQLKNRLNPTSDWLVRAQQWDTRLF